MNLQNRKVILSKATEEEHGKSINAWMLWRYGTCDHWPGNTDDSLGYPVFQSLEACDVEVDAIIDFTAAPAVDHLLDYCAEKKVPVVLCSTGLSEAQMAKLSESAKKVPVLRSANMSLGINL